MCRLGCPPHLALSLPTLLGSGQLGQLTGGVGADTPCAFLLCRKLPKVGLTVQAPAPPAWVPFSFLLVPFWPSVTSGFLYCHRSGADQGPLAVVPLMEVTRQLAQVQGRGENISLATVHGPRAAGRRLWTAEHSHRSRGRLLPSPTGALGTEEGDRGPEHSGPRGRHREADHVTLPQAPGSPAGFLGPLATSLHCLYPCAKHAGPRGSPKCLALCKALPGRLSPHLANSPPCSGTPQQASPLPALPDRPGGYHALLQPLRPLDTTPGDPEPGSSPGLCLRGLCTPEVGTSPTRDNGITQTPNPDGVPAMPALLPRAL